MGWQQDYKFPALYELVRVLQGKGIKNKDIINLALRNMALPHIEKMEQIEVDHDQWQSIYGWRVTLSNGEIYMTVRNEEKSFTRDGNYGCDIYEWRKVK